MASPQVLVVGGGPAGASTAFWLAREGHDVTLVEKKEFPRNKTCGDGLTPRAILQLTEMGFDFDVPEFHRITGLRSYAGADLMLEMEWPQHSRFPDWGGVIRRRDLDDQVARLAEKQGVKVREKTEAKPVVEDGRLAAVTLTQDGNKERVEPD
ncbi:MAG TPA: FAD-dependent oxidoreductase, partial [Acidimicrobiia bacterium]|nr:FAD-dependent oxidoreductase [Acidimicrobiia bacterium]